MTFPARLRETLSTHAEVRDAVDEDGRDWWPLSKVWARQGRVPARADLVVRPASAAAVAAVLAVCNEWRVPVTPAGARSGVCGGAIPLAGGVALELLGLDAVVDLDEESLTVTAQAGVMGGALEAWLGKRGYSTRHFPQSLDISTVGGWVACRSAGQWSTRYGKIEHMLRGLEVALVDGSRLRLPPAPARATGPDLLQLFCGSEGTLGVVTEVTLAVHRLPAVTHAEAFAVGSMAEGIGAIRRVMQRGARPPVMRLYDETETRRQYAAFLDEGCILLALTEGEEGLVAWERSVLREECGRPIGSEPVEHWLAHRNDVSQLDAAVARGFVVDTCEVAAPWRDVVGVYTAGVGALKSVEGTVAATAHCSHAYSDGACLYFTLAGHAGDDPEAQDRWYSAAWSRLMSAAVGAGAVASHHHGIGLLRAAWLSDGAVLQRVKDALDPNGILNPGKLGLTNRLGIALPDWPVRIPEETLSHG